MGESCFWRNRTFFTRTTAPLKWPSHIGVPKFTAFIHAPTIEGLAQTLRSARIASDILVIHNGDPAVQRLCLRSRARSKAQIPGVTPGAYAMDTFYNWLLLLKPGEELSEETLRALAEWRRRRQDNCAGYLIRSEESGRPQLRFVNRAMVNWIGEFPPVPTHAGIFPGVILRSDSLRAA